MANDTIDSFISAVDAIVSKAGRINGEERKLIRDTVGAVADELDRALSLADSCLAGSAFSKDAQSLATYLSTVDAKLMNSYLEHHICSGLYTLADKFEQTFAPTRFAVNVSNSAEIRALVTHLKHGERAVVDALDDIVSRLRSIGIQVANAGPTDLVQIKADLAQQVAADRKVIVRFRRSIKSARRSLTDKL